MCKCEQNSEFNSKIREAYAKGLVVWQTASGELVVGTREKAEQRLKNGTIQCYFVPRIYDGKITFKTILKTEEPEPVASAVTKSKTSRTAEVK